MARGGGINGGAGVTPFPPQLPADLDDLSVIARNDREAFLGIGHMDTHWCRPGWADGRRSYHWMLAFGEVETAPTGALADYVARAQKVVPSAGFDLVAAAGVHLTLGRVGFIDELPERVAMEVAEHAQRLEDPPHAFELTFGPLTGSRGAIRFSVGPWTPLLHLHRFLTAATRQVLGQRCVMHTPSFRPHVSIAYANTHVPVHDVAAALAGAPALAGPRVGIRQVSLVEMERVGRSYRHHPFRHLSLVDRSRAASAAGLARD